DYHCSSFTGHKRLF
nr:immunoglobulin light chain junction region [Macaca mulatta]